MILIRRILIAVIALSVAVLPATAKATALSAPTEVTMADHADMPCCPSCNDHGDFKTAACVLKCAALASAVLPAITVALLCIADGSPFGLTEDPLHGAVRPPPTHPPPA
jgi:hypothetical protein